MTVMLLIDAYPFSMRLLSEASLTASALSAGGVNLRSYII